MATTTKSSRPRKEARETSSSSKNLDWFSSDAKQVMAQCFLDGILPLDGELDAEDIYDSLFAGHPAFEDWPFAKELYDGRLSRLQDVIGKRQKWTDYDTVALKKDREIFPVRQFNSKNEPVWKGSEADTWLRMDIQDELHLTMKPKELWKTRECYQSFSKERFRKRIDQIKQAEKPFGVTPGQEKSRRLGNPKLSLLLNGGGGVVEGGNTEDEEEENEGSS